MQPSVQERTDLARYETYCLAHALIQPFQAQYVQSKLQLGHDEQFTYHLGIAKGMITRYPAWRDWWENQRNGGLLEPGFVEAIDNFSGPMIGRWEG
jgi:hypothetical protein